MSSDVFQEMSEEDILKMLEVLRQDWPKHFLLYQMVTGLREYKKAGSTWIQTVYLHGDYNTGVYLQRVKCTPQCPEGESFHVYTLSSDVTIVQDCLKSTEVIPWKSKGLWFHLVDTKLTDAIREVFALKNASYSSTLNTLFWFPPQKEIHAQEIPEDVCLEFLDESYAEEMDKNWPHRYPNSVLVHAENIRRNFGLGLFRKSDKRLLSSALSTFLGGIFVLYTDPEFRGRGYAGLVVEGMTREIRRRGRIPFCTVIVNNKASESTFTKAGFEPWSKVEWIGKN